jgi:hypothetical protein
MPVPNDYGAPGGATIMVDPDLIYQLATNNIPAYIGQVADSINRVVGIWNNLKVGWVGKTAQEAQDFNDRWVTSITDLFGTSADPGTGVLPKIAYGLSLAGMNYGEAEDVVTNMFKKLTAALQQSGSS